MEKKYIFITGGVCSSLGKGLTAASIGLLLEKLGLKIAMIKLDPYLNVDPGTMNPFQHGEVYVTDDGAETDLDLGHYHRFTHSPLSKISNVTSGQIYNSVIRRERRGDFLGNTVQVIPHITNEIKKRIHDCANQTDDIDVTLVEVGGTVGDIESLPFLEAIRQLNHEHSDTSINIHLTYVPYLAAAGELKTKPTQQSVQILRGIGIFPNIILCRSESPLPDEVTKKISLFCNVPQKAVIEEVDVKTSIYEVPLHLQEQGLTGMICKQLKIPEKEIDLCEWKKMIETIRNPEGTITVGIVGKYLQHQDAYKSIFEALFHAATKEKRAIHILPIEADKLKTMDDLEPLLKQCDGLLVPGGYGERGWEGKILSAQYARETKLPYLGICLGMQVMCIEFVRNVLGFAEANSTEIDPETKEPVISLLAEQKALEDLGGTMRLGSYPCEVTPNTHAYSAYQKENIRERHRHRYEFNNHYKEMAQEKGLVFSGLYKEADLCEIVEIAEHPWMVGVQFHPEYLSRALEPHPLFSHFIQALINHKRKNEQ